MATFLVSFGFFGAAIFLPQWFQFVQGATPTNSGLYSLALLAGLIISSIVSGILVSRTGKYKAIILVGLAVMAVGLYLMSNIRADTELPVLWVWMFVTGVGIGPTLAVFTIVVQNAVPIRSLGVATSNLTFFRQIGGSVGLALLGTVFGNRLGEEIGPQILAAGVPKQMVDQFAAQNSGSAATDLIKVGSDLGASILAGLPEAVRPLVEPLIPNIVFGIHQSFSLAISEVFLIGMGTTVAALVIAVFMPELPLRATMGQRPIAEVGAAAAVGADEIELPAMRRRRARPGLNRSRRHTGPAALRVAGPFDSPRYHRAVTEILPYPPALAAAGTGGCPVPAALPAGRAAPGSHAPGLVRRPRHPRSPTPSEGVCAVDDRCPHMAAPLSIGELDGCVVACPLHSGRFDLATGDPVQMPTTGGLRPGWHATSRCGPHRVASPRRTRPARRPRRGA